MTVTGPLVIMNLVFHFSQYLNVHMEGLQHSLERETPDEYMDNAHRANDQVNDKSSMQSSRLILSSRYHPKPATPKATSERHLPKVMSTFPSSFY